jgi:hypothetical protein
VVEELLVLKGCVCHGLAELCVGFEVLVLELVMQLGLLIVIQWASTLRLVPAFASWASRF